MILLPKICVILKNYPRHIKVMVAVIFFAVPEVPSIRLPGLEQGILISGQTQQTTANGLS